MKKICATILAISMAAAIKIAGEIAVANAVEVKI